MNTLSFPLLVLSALALSACSLGGKAVPLTVIEPQIEPIVIEGLAPVDWSIEVARPITDQTRDSDRLIVRRSGGRLQFYPGVSWVDSLPDMVQTLLVQAFTDSDTVTGAARAGIRARFALATELRRFELVDDGDGRLVELVITARLIDREGEATAAVQTFRSTARPDSTTLPSMIDAFEAALAELTRKLIEWSVEAGEPAAAESP
jgi:cholesterol transport system auxiliary component